MVAEVGGRFSRLEIFIDCLEGLVADLASSWAARMEKKIAFLKAELERARHGEMRVLWEGGFGGWVAVSSPRASSATCGVCTHALSVRQGNPAVRF